ncbi:hypothetical protein WJX73_002928 [Symbiochloris irregularis]|uniref:Coiled-coil domain-containing protein 61 n=1 Tax=Symbiochloris irregularis TaxID=706552 RepID=A0AAW1P0F6_9CHLO
MSESSAASLDLCRTSSTPQGGRLETVQCCFQGTDFTVSVSTVRTDVLQITVEQLTDSSQWQGAFSARHIEEIASKTGSFKTYALFVKMLLTSLKRQSGTVVTDLLTYRDLHQLQQGAGPPPPPEPAGISQPDPSANKRYLILTYVSEFDRVHYPLPLHYVASPDPEYLKGIIARLRSEAKRGSLGPESSEGKARGAIRAIADARQLRDENSHLQQQLTAQGDLEAQLAAAHHRLEESERSLATVTAERQEATTKLASMRAELEAERVSAHRTAESQRVELEAAQMQVLDLSRQLHLHASLDRQMDARSAMIPPLPTASTSRSGRGPHLRRSGSHNVESAWGRRHTPSRDEGDRSYSRARSAPPTPPGRFDPTAFVEALQRKRRDSSPRYWGRSSAAGSASPARSASLHSGEGTPRGRTQRRPSLDRLTSPTASSRARTRTPSPPARATFSQSPRTPSLNSNLFSSPPHPSRSSRHSSPAASRGMSHALRNVQHTLAQYIAHGRGSPHAKLQVVKEEHSMDGRGTFRSEPDALVKASGKFLNGTGV